MRKLHDLSTLLGAGAIALGVGMAVPTYARDVNDPECHSLMEPMRHEGYFVQGSAKNKVTHMAQFYAGGCSLVCTLAASQSTDVTGKTVTEKMLTIGYSCQQTAVRGVDQVAADNANIRTATTLVLKQADRNGNRCVSGDEATELYNSWFMNRLHGLCRDAHNDYAVDIEWHFNLDTETPLPTEPAAVPLQPAPAAPSPTERLEPQPADATTPAAPDTPKAPIVPPAPKKAPVAE